MSRNIAIAIPAWQYAQWHFQKYYVILHACNRVHNIAFALLLYAYNVQCYSSCM